MANCETCKLVKEMVEKYRDTRDHWDWDNLIDDLLFELKKGE